MKVILDFGGDRECDITSLDAGGLVWAKLPDLSVADEDDLRGAQRHVLEETYASSGLERVAVGTRVLTPLEGEMKRRGLVAVYWSRELWARSNRASCASDN